MLQSVPGRIDDPHPDRPFLFAILFLVASICFVIAAYSVGYDSGRRDETEADDARYRRLSEQMRGLGVCDWARAMLEDGPYGKRGKSCAEMEQDPLHP